MQENTNICPSVTCSSRGTSVWSEKVNL